MPESDILGDIEQSAGRVKADREFAQLKRKYDALSGQYKHALKELEEAEARVAFVEEIQPHADGRAIERLRKGSGGESSAVLVLTDWHVEETVDPATVNGANEYNLKIAEKRAKKVFQKAVELIEFARGFTKINELVVPLLGDFLTGYIHEELEESNSLSPTQACLFIEDLLMEGFDLLLRECKVKRIIVPTCHGNHGRTTKKKRISTSHKNSFEWLMYQQMARYHRREPRVEWKIGNAYHNWLTVQGHDVRLHHGDAIRYGGGIGGISIPVNKKVAAWNQRQRAAVDFFGHWHQYHDWGPWVSCNCLIGYSAYAMEIGAEWQPPSQTFAVVSRKHGRVLTMQVHCE